MWPNIASGLKKSLRAQITAWRLRSGTRGQPLAVFRYTPRLGLSLPRSLFSQVVSAVPALVLMHTDALAEPLSSPAVLVAKIDAAQQGLRSLRADFVQMSRVKLFSKPLRSEGRLLYAKGPPARLLWEYVRPDPSAMVVVGEQATLKMGNGAPQVMDASKSPMLRAIFTQLRLWLGQGSLKEAESEYNIASGGTAQQPALLLTPKTQTELGKIFTRIELHVDGKTMFLKRLVMFEKNGDEKEVIFGKTERNIEVNTAQFQ